MSVDVRGNPAGETIVFVSGFPDNHAVWLESLVPYFEKTHRCVSICMPGYESPTRKISRFGLSAKQITAAFEAAVHANAPFSQKIYIVAHDWGCLIAQNWVARHPERVKALVLLDVLSLRGDSFLAGGARAAAVKASYTALFAVAFLFSIVSVTLGNAFLYFSFLLLGLLKLAPDADPPRRRLIAPPAGPQGWMCYPYLVLWKALLCGACGARSLPVPRDPPPVPTLFAYGTRKRAMFHTPEGARRLAAANPRSVVKAFDCGHWIQHKRTAELAADVAAFFKQ